jgi:hypothetical protein
VVGRARMPDLVHVHGAGEPRRGYRARPGRVRTAAPQTTLGV